MSKDSDGNISISSSDFDKDGNPVDPDSAEGNAESEGITATTIDGDGTIHQTINGGGETNSYSSDMTIRPDGTGSVTAIGSTSIGENTTATVSAHAEGSFDGSSGSGFTTVDVSEDGTGKHTYDTVGVNSAGDEFRTAGGADGQGNDVIPKNCSSSKLE